jgi:hypothetical protein
MTGPSNPAIGRLFLGGPRWRVDVYAEIGTGFRQTRRQLWVSHFPTRERAEHAAIKRAAHEGSRGWREAHPNDNIVWVIASPDGQLSPPIKLFVDTPPIAFVFEQAAKPKSALRPLVLTAAQQQLMLEALEIRMSDLTEREEVLAVGEIGNMLRVELNMAPREYWED